MPAPTFPTSAFTGPMIDGGWAGGSGLILTYSVATSTSTWPYYDPGDDPFDGASWFNATQNARFSGAMELWDSYVAAQFNKTADATNPGAIRIGFTDIENAGTWGYAYLPSGGGWTPNATSGIAGDIWVDNSLTGTTFEVGSYDWMSLLHEIGHALGLDHTFVEEEDPPTDHVPEGTDSIRYSIMSYSDTGEYFKIFSEDTSFFYVNFGDVNAITPMLFDIYAVQSLYGADPNTRSGATTYTFDPSAYTLQTIYDAGGVDTWNLSGHVRPSTIDLRPASFSSIDYYSRAAQIEAGVALLGEEGRSFVTTQINLANTYLWTNNVAIAYGTIIENVICGDAADTVVGNDVANNIQGRGGADTLTGLNGNDTLDGGTGADIMKGGKHNDIYIVDNIGDKTTEVANYGTDLVKSSISWTLSANVESLQLTGTAASGAGNTLNNTLIGNASNNVLNGLDGDDKINGGAGNDDLKGSAGHDTLTGAAGNDHFIFAHTGAANSDIITDFVSVNDSIYIDNAVFTTIGANGALAANAFRSGASATTAEHRIIYNSISGELFFDADGVGGSAQVLLATLTGAPALNVSDIIII